MLAAVAGRRGVRPIAARTVRAATVLAVGVVFVVPIWIMIVGSLRPTGLPPASSPELLPRDLAFSNYVEVFRVVPLGRSIANSLVVAAVAVPLGVVVASWAGFAIARLGGRSAAVLAAIAATAALVPVAAVLLGRVALWRIIGSAGTPLPLMATGLIGVTPLTVLLFAWGFRRVPSEIYDLALEAGLSPLATWYRVAMPLIRPITAAAAGLAFLASWGSSIEPLVLLRNDRWFTVQVVLSSLSALDPPFRPLMLAGAVVAVVPAMAAFAVVVRGVSRATMIGRPGEGSSTS